MADIRARGNTFNLAFTFTDENGDAATVASATCQLVWRALNDFDTATLTLALNVTTWDITWDSSVARAGWVEYHAHAIGSGGESYTEDNRFKISGNRASLQHDKLPTDSSEFDYAVV